MAIRDKNSEVISPKDLNEIRERYEKTGSSQWIWFEEEPERPYDPVIVVVAVQNSGHISKLTRLFALSGEDDGHQELAEFICKTREDIPKLLTAIARLKELREEREILIEPLVSEPPF